MLKFTESLDEANHQIGKMQEVLQNPNDPRIKTAFGPNANVAEISKVVDMLASKKLKVQSMDPNLADDQAGRSINGFVPVENGTPQSAKFGSTFFGEQETWHSDSFSPPSRIGCQTTSRHHHSRSNPPTCINR